MTALDRVMIAVSVARVAADLLVLTVAPHWRPAAGQLAPLVSAVQMIWVISAVRRAARRGPYSSSSSNR